MACLAAYKVTDDLQSDDNSSRTLSKHSLNKDLGCFIASEDLAGLRAYLELVVAANARLPNAARLADRAVVVIAGDVWLVNLTRHVGACARHIPMATALLFKKKQPYDTPDNCSRFMVDMHALRSQ